VCRGKKQSASVSAPILAALTSAANSMAGGSAKPSVQPASARTPDVPPGSSLKSFLRQNPQTPGLVLADFDEAFSNPYYQSSFDDVGNIDADVIADAATLVARALLNLAGGDMGSGSLPTANPSLVTDLVRCLLVASPGLSCSLVQNLTTPSTTAGFANHYVGILQEGPSSQPFLLDSTSRFLWNLLANMTGSAVNGSTCEGTCPAGQACVGWTAARKGTCLNATAR
jgi:nicastrin